MHRLRTARFRPRSRCLTPGTVRTLFVLCTTRGSPARVERVRFPVPCIWKTWPHAPSLSLAKPTRSRMYTHVSCKAVDETCQGSELLISFSLPLVSNPACGQQEC